MPVILNLLILSVCTASAIIFYDSAVLVKRKRFLNVLHVPSQTTDKMNFTTL